MNAISTTGGIGILGAISRTILSEDRRSFWGFIRGLTCAFFVAFVAGGLIDDYKLSPGMHNLIVGVSSFVADDILMLILKLAKMVTVNPGVALDWLIEFLSGFRGKK